MEQRSDTDVVLFFVVLRPLLCTDCVAKVFLKLRLFSGGILYNGSVHQVRTKVDDIGSL